WIHHSDLDRGAHADWKTVIVRCQLHGVCTGQTPGVLRQWLVAHDSAVSEVPGAGGRAAIDSSHEGERESNGDVGVSRLQGGSEAAGHAAGDNFISTHRGPVEPRLSVNIDSAAISLVACSDTRRADRKVRG